MVATKVVKIYYAVCLNTLKEDLNAIKTKVKEVLDVDDSNNMDSVMAIKICIITMVLAAVTLTFNPLVAL